MIAKGFVTGEVDQGVHRIVDVLGNHAYLVEGQTRALLVDCCAGFGDLRACVEELTSLPVTVVVTHGHEDHMMGSYWFDEARISPLDGGVPCWKGTEERTKRIYEQIVNEGVIAAEAPYALRDGTRPTELPSRKRRRRRT